MPDTGRFSVFIEQTTWQFPGVRPQVLRALSQDGSRGEGHVPSQEQGFGVSGSHISLPSLLARGRRGHSACVSLYFGAGGFTHDELLKVWKGLFYCMWMQDKPLLQVSVGGAAAGAGAGAAVSAGQMGVCLGLTVISLKMTSGSFTASMPFFFPPEARAFGWGGSYTCWAEHHSHTGDHQ